jgi:hypothetical protein
MTLRIGTAIIVEGEVSHGTLRIQDLLRTFAAELERLSPTNCAAMARDMRAQADIIDSGEWGYISEEIGAEGIVAAEDHINYILAQHGSPYYFGANEGDGSSIGYWSHSE